MAGRLIQPGDERLMDPTQVGHKFARQERLRLAGFRVPPLFCVPVAEFDSVRRDMLAAPPDSRAEEEVLAWARESAGVLTALDVPRALAAEILDVFDTVAGADGLVAVRACVVVDERGVGEDSASDAFAGLTDSFLYVGRHDVPSRIVRCWASGLSPGSIRYRLRRGLPPSSVRVAVGVQEMVLGVRSFVAFSRDPRTGRTSSVVAAAHGIGEGVVAERADVDHFFVDRGTGEIGAETVRKERMVTGNGVSGEVVTCPVPAELSMAPVLADEEVRQVAELAVTLEEHFGFAQDIEGTITPNGVIHLLQARPVVFADSVASAGPRIPWSNNNITESFAGVSAASTFSQARIFYRLIFRDAYRRMGIPAARLRSQEHHLNRMVGQLDGRVYYRLDAWLALHGQIPGFAFIQKSWARSMGLTERTPPSRADLVRAVPTVPALALRLARHPGSVRRFLRWWDGLFDGCTGMDRLSPEELIAFHRRLWAEVGRWWGITLVNGFFLYACVGATSALICRWVTEDDQRIIGGLLLGGRENRSVLAVRSAIALAELVSRHPTLAGRLRRDPADEIWADVADGRYGRELAAAAATHLHRYGDRAMHDLKLEELSPRQRPSMIIDMIRPMVHNGLTGAGNRERERAARADAERELRERCPSTVRRLTIRALATGLRWLVNNREDTRFCRSQLFGLTRQVLWNLGRHLVEAGVLEDRADVFDLTVEEVFGAYDGTLVDPDLRSLVRERRWARHAAAARPDLDAELSTSSNLPVPIELPARVADQRNGAERTELRGLASSHGVVRYPARVVLDPTIPPESCRDRIIVAKETDPGWLFLMMAARGLVVERGTLLSHTALTGRLLGVPTVVSVPGATSLIPDGALIEIDGAAGTVRLL